MRWWVLKLVFGALFIWPGQLRAYLMKGRTMFSKLFKGGFLSGYKTYILGGLMALQAFASWAVGDTSLQEFLAELPEILGGLGLITLRAGVAKGES